MEGVEVYWLAMSQKREICLVIPYCVLLIYHELFVIVGDFLPQLQSFEQETKEAKFALETVAQEKAGLNLSLISSAGRGQIAHFKARRGSRTNIYWIAVEIVK